MSYSLASPAYVTLNVYDITGSLVETLVNEYQKPGVHRVHWDAADSPSGVYFITLQTANHTTTDKMILLR